MAFPFQPKQSKNEGCLTECPWSNDEIGISTTYATLKHLGVDSTPQKRYPGHRNARCNITDKKKR
jgi:hypothetical protein